MNSDGFLPLKYIDSSYRVVSSGKVVDLPGTLVFVNANLGWKITHEQFHLY